MLELRGQRWNLHKFVGSDAGGNAVELYMPRTKLFGGKGGRIKVDDDLFELRAKHNRLWMLDRAGKTTGFAELSGLRAEISVEDQEIELVRRRSKDKVAEVIRGGDLVGAVNGNGRGDRVVRVEIAGINQLRGLAFVAAVAVGGWRDFRSSAAYNVSGTPYGWYDGSGVGDWDDRDYGGSSDGGGFWDGFGGGDGGGGGGGDGGGG